MPLLQLVLQHLALSPQAPPFGVHTGGMPSQMPCAQGFPPQQSPSCAQAAPGMAQSAAQVPSTQGTPQQSLSPVQAMGSAMQGLAHFPAEQTRSAQQSAPLPQATPAGAQQSSPAQARAAQQPVPPTQGAPALEQAVQRASTQRLEQQASSWAQVAPSTRQAPPPAPDPPPPAPDPPPPLAPVVVLAVLVVPPDPPFPLLGVGGEELQAAPIRAGEAIAVRSHRRQFMKTSGADGASMPLGADRVEVVLRGPGRADKTMISRKGPAKVRPFSGGDRPRKSRRLDMASRMRLRQVLALGLAALGFGTVSGGCSGAIGPGDYRLYKMEFIAPTKSTGCFFPDKGPDANSGSDSDTTLATDVWVITADTAGFFYIDLGNHSLQGAVTDTGYAFTGTKVDVEFDQDDPKKTKRTVTVVETINVTVDGKSISGDAIVDTSFACSGAGCTNIPTCTVDTKFSGTQVDDVQLQRDVK